MIGLLKKEIYSIKKPLLFYLSLAIAFGFFCVIQQNAAFFIFYVSMLVLGLSLTSIQYDEMNHWTGYALCLPVSRSKLCISKYLFSFCLLTYGCIVYFFFAPFINFNDTAELLMNFKLLITVCLVFLSLFLPISIRFGTAKARLVIFPVTIIGFITGYVLDYLKVPEPSTSQLADALLYAPYFSVALYLLSLGICIGLMKKKEF